MTAAIAHRRAVRAQARNRLRQRVHQAIEEVAPELAARRSGAGLSLEELRQIVAKLGDPDSSGRLNHLKQMLRVLAYQLRELQRHTDGDVTLPVIPVTIRRKPSPFTSQRLGSLPPLRKLMDSFLASLVARDDSPELMAGQILLSSVVFGGLVNKASIRALPKAINANAYAHNDLFWLDLVPYPAQSPQMVRRWFPDPLSQCLILRWRARGCRWPTNSVEALIWQQMRILDQHFGTQGLTLQKLIDANTTRLRQELPALLVDFLTSAEHGQSLPARAWWRLIDDYQLATTEPQDKDPLDLVPPDSTTQPSSWSSSGNTSTDDLSGLLALTRALRNPAGGGSIRPSVALRSIRSMSFAAGGPMLKHLVGWSVWMMEGGSGTRIRPSSVRRYLNAFAKPLIALAGDWDPRTSPAEAIAQRYEEVLQAVVVGGQRAMASVGIRHFHAYLMLTCDLPQVEIDGVCGPDQTVQPNTVSEPEFLRIVQAFELSGMRERSKQMLQLVLILLYRLGLRRSELAWLRLSDIQIDEHGLRPLLWVHSHPQSSVKTHSSVRRLALAHLIPRNEIKVLLAWRTHRISELGRAPQKEALLFCELGADTTRLDDEVINEIVSMVRRVSGDDTIVLHTFRHAFASNLFANIMHAGWLATTRGAELRLAKEDKRLPWQSRDTSPSLLRAHFFADQLPRGGAYLLAVHAGHLDPDETMRTYVHHQDYLAHLYLREMAHEFPNRLWAAVEGITEAALKVRHSRHRKKSGTMVVACRDTPARLLGSARLPKPSGRNADPNVKTLVEVVRPTRATLEVRLDAVYRALSMMNTPMTIQARTMVSGFEAPTLKSLYLNARFLAGLTTDSRNRSARRSRHLKPLPARPRPRMASRPQLDKVGPALPRRAVDLDEARRVFDRALSGDHRAMLARLLDLLGRTSRSDPALSFGTIESLNAGIESLRLVGIAAVQMQVVIRALPRGDVTAKRWRAMVSKALDTRVPVVLLERPGGVPRSRTRTPAGRLALEVRRSNQAANGWRVGSFYAAALLAARTDTDLSVLASTPGDMRIS